MGAPFDEPAYPHLQAHDFGPGRPYGVAVHHSGHSVAIGDVTDAGFLKTHALLQPGPHAVDVVLHGLPGRFLEKLSGSWQIPASVIAQLLATAGVPARSRLRLLTCHAGEAPLNGPAAAQQLASEWGGEVEAANGLLRVRVQGFRIDLVDWVPDPLGGSAPSVIGVGQGSWLLFHP